MAEQQQAPHHCQFCGLSTADFTRLRDQVETLESALTDAEKELRAKRAQISRLKGEQRRQQAADPLSEAAWKVYEFWREHVAPQAREFSGNRFEAVVARLRAGHSLDTLKKAVLGAKARPRKGGGVTDLETICRNERNLLMFVSFYEEERRAKESRRHLVPPERLAAWQQALDRPDRLERLQELRGWKPEVVKALGLGLDRNRVVFPFRDADGTLVGLGRYAPNPDRRQGPKMLAEGSREMFPAPEEVSANTCWLVEGEADAVALRSIGLPAVAVPGVAVWKQDWPERFARFERVYVCFDCDEEGRKAADARLHALASHTQVQVVELDVTRDDGFDVTNFIALHGAKAVSRLSALATGKTGVVKPFRRSIEDEEWDGKEPFERIVEALERHGKKVNHRQHGHATSQCPCHDDAHPSMSLSEGDDGRVLIHCHAGCEPAEIVGALGLQMKDLFARRAS